MKRIKRKAEQFLLGNSSWIFFTTILLISYVMMVESGQYTWPYYASYVLSTTLLFLPVLAFALFRGRLKEKLGRNACRALWAGGFLAWPVLLAMAQAYLSGPLFIFPPQGQAVPSGYVLVTGVGFLLAEVAIQLNGYLLRRKGAGRWLKQDHFEKNLLLLVVILASVLGAAFAYRPFSAGAPAGFAGFVQRIPLFVSYTFQFLLILMAYSFFYFVNHYFLVPILLKKKGLLYYGFGIAGAILAFYPFLALLLGGLPAVRLEGALLFTAHEIFPSDRGGLPFAIMVLSAPLIIGMEWQKQSTEIARLEQERAAAELNLLKQQVNPHFFFNTLNNLYALSITRDRQTPEVILQLSELMRYVIYRGKEESVELAEEVKYIEDYIRLQRIRLHKKLDYRFEKDIADEKLRIPPLMFITLVENAFKHGIEPAEKACFLHMSLKSDGAGLLFTCANSFENAEPGNGVGLSNLRRRLELLFPERHELQAEQSGHAYSAMLKLAL
ncbi:MAG: histidine kinase [Phaeodactylibacter sp.]|nr:histidine kinase [Phaeodactylibacter sp.]